MKLINKTIKLKRLIPYLIVFFAVSSVVFFMEKMSPNEVSTEKLNEGAYLEYKSDAYGIAFSYPESWGPIEVVAPNTQCPEEDTYRTPDTLSIIDNEFKFKDTKLNRSESFIRSGVKVFKLTINKKNDCNDMALEKIATGEMSGKEFSSFKLETLEVGGMKSVWNTGASRLNTEGREQYTIFKKISDSEYLLIQPYMSFIPYFGSPELIEMEDDFKGDMDKFLKSGKTSAPIREFQTEFRKMAESVKEV